MTLIVCMVLLGSALVIAEVLFPSFGLLGLMAAGTFLVAVLEGFEMGDSAGYTVLGVVIASIPGAVFAGIQTLQRTALGNRILLQGPRHEEVTGGAADSRLGDLTGQTGITATPLHPSGFVEIGEDRVDAVSAGPFMESGTPVRVVHVEGNRVVVEATQDEEESV